MTTRQQAGTPSPSNANGFSGPPQPLREIDLTDNARTVLAKRYLRKGPDGQPAETEHEMFWRVASHIAQAEVEMGGDQFTWAQRFYDLLTEIRFFPNSPTFTGAGTPLGQLAACFVLAIEDDMGRSTSGIFQTLRDAALIQQTGGGNGFAFSRLRPKGALVKSSMGQATGPVGFLRVYDQAFGEIAQGGSRRGANMAVLRVDHPDIREFVSCKTGESHITNFNISVGITDAFMQAVLRDEPFDLVNPVDGKVWETVNARELFDQITRQAHHNGEPGALFLDAANRTNPVPQLYELEATNPCFVGDTRIASQHGLLTIKEMADRELPLFVATDNRAPFAGVGKPESGQNGVALRAATPAWQTRRRVPVKRLATRQGYTVTATPDHPFLTPDGYVALEDLKPGDSVYLQSGEGAWNTSDELPNMMPLHEAMGQMALAGDRASAALIQRADFQALYAGLPTRWSHELGLVMGYLVGDGWLTEGGNGSLGFAFGQDHNLALVHEPMREWFGDGHIHHRGSVKQLTYARVPFEFFKALGVIIAPAYEKRLPDSIWRAPREAVVGFLQGLFSADGSAQVNLKKQDCTVRLASSSPGLLDDVQVLLSNFGIVSRVYHRRQAGVRPMPDGKGGSKDYAFKDQYELVIGKANRDRFAELIGFADHVKQDRLTAFIGGKRRRSNHETFTDRVLSVEDAGLADVYDLTEPQTHSLIANGFIAHNCGEQFLGPFENCCLGSINLAQHMTDDGRVDWARLQQSVEEATRFLDDVVSANAYVPAVPQLKEAAHRVRRIGLGIMGLADMMYRLGVRYGSPDGQEFGAQVMEFVRFHAMRASIDLAEERGPFPAIAGSIYDPANLAWRPPQPLQPYERDWDRPALNWDTIVAGIRAHGIRNGAQATVAPTGTISTVAGCEGYGCEPVFALAYVRHVNDNGQDLELQYTSPAFERVLRQAGLGDEAIARVVAQVNQDGTCQHITDLPAHIRDTFVVSSDVTTEEHVRMQAALQTFVDNSISKTINMPADASVDDVKRAYKLAWDLGCKGLTVYVTGSRQKVVLETNATRAAQGKAGEPAPELPVAVGRASQQPLFNEHKKPRPRRLAGQTYRVATPLGTTYVTVNENGHGEGQPFEVFLHATKAGSDTAAVSEALGRLISYVLRLASPVSPRKRLKEIVRQLSGIGGGRPMGFGPARVLSLPDGIAQVLQDYLSDSEAVEVDAEEALLVEQEPLPLPAASRAIGDLCPECGQATLVNEEGCRKCYTCSYSEC